MNPETWKENYKEPIIKWDARNFSKLIVINTISIVLEGKLSFL